MALFGLKYVFFCTIVTFVRGNAFQKESYNLTILHMNDVHAHFDEINVNSGKNTDDSLVNFYIFINQDGVIKTRQRGRSVLAGWVGCLRPSRAFKIRTRMELWC